MGKEYRLSDYKEKYEVELLYTEDDTPKYSIILGNRDTKERNIISLNEIQLESLYKLISDMLMTSIL